MWLKKSSLLYLLLSHNMSVLFYNIIIEDDFQLVVALEIMAYVHEDSI